MLEALLESPGTVIAGLGILVLGYLVKYREWTFLVAGYDASTDVPKSVASDVVGNLTLRVGVATVAFGVLTAAMPVPEAVTVGFAAVVVLAAGRAVYRLRTHPGASA